MIFRSLISALIIVISSGSTIAQKGEIFKINSDVSIEFPEKPSFQKAKGLDVYYSSSNYGQFLVMSLNITDTRGTPINSESDRQEFYAGVINGLKTKSKGGKPKVQKCKVGGYDGVSIQLSIETDSAEEIWTQKTVLIGDNSYSLVVKTTPEFELKNEKMKNAFFNSFHASEDLNSDTAYNAGYMFGQLILPLCFIGGLVALILYFTGRSRAKNNA
jgi:hypothetical protein